VRACVCAAYVCVCVREREGEILVVKDCVLMIVRVCARVGTSACVRERDISVVKYCVLMIVRACVCVCVKERDR
jgi:hypothetical protein